MELSYSNKKPREDILVRDVSYKLLSNNSSSNNKLIHGDNLQCLKSLLYDFKLQVDLIYTDPPFSTNTNFTIGERSNSISSSYLDEVAYSDTLKGADYLEYIRERIIVMYELLSPKGSMYLHIDYKIGHYVKLIMDEIFGIKNFRNDITRIKCNPKNFSRRSYGNIKDLILFYTKSDDYVWNEPQIPLEEKDINKLFKKKDSKGRLYTTIPLHAPGETENGETSQLFKGMPPPRGRHWRSKPAELEKLDQQGLIEWSKNGVPRKIIFADDAIKKGKKLQDIWEYKDPQYPLYPTAKNLELLNLIVSTSSNIGDTVLDPFAGSGTTLISADNLQRHWIGIDQSLKSIEVIKKRFANNKETLFNLPFEEMTLHSATKSNAI